MRILPVPCLKDNFAYLVGSEHSRSVVVVDPSEPRPILSALKTHGLSLSGILCTHHHWDHVGGNEALLAALGPLPVYAHESDLQRIPGQNIGVVDGERFEGAGVEFRVLFIPGHTQGQVAYLCADAVFVGDTLFGAGCGRLREGSAEQLYASLVKLSQLPEDTRIYFGHEYTEANLRFARSVEPTNLDIIDRQKRTALTRSTAAFTCPTTLAEERRTNPFLRVAESSVIAHFSGELNGTSDPVSVFAAARRAKDVFQ